MKTSILCLLALLGVTGCGKSQSASNTTAGQTLTTAVQPADGKITAEQARATAVKLANDKCDSLYQQHPFRASNLPVFMGGRWVWTAVQGVGLADAEVKVELAADGSTNRVDIKMLDNRLSQRVMIFQPFPQRIP